MIKLLLFYSNFVCECEEHLLYSERQETRGEAEDEEDKNGRDVDEVCRHDSPGVANFFGGEPNSGEPLQKTRLPHFLQTKGVKEEIKPVVVLRVLISKMRYASHL